MQSAPSKPAQTMKGVHGANMLRFFTAALLVSDYGRG